MRTLLVRELQRISNNASAVELDEAINFLIDRLADKKKEMEKEAEVEAMEEEDDASIFDEVLEDSMRSIGMSRVLDQNYEDHEYIHRVYT